MHCVNNNIKLVLICIVFLLSRNLYSQNKAKKERVYKVWVKFLNKTQQKGFLYAVDDSSLKIVSNKSLKNLSDVNTIKAKNISKIYIKKKGKGWRSTLSGTLGTTLVIESMLMASNSDEGSYISNEATAVGMGFLLGAPIGALVGTVRKKFVIFGDENVFKAKYQELNKYALFK